MSIRIDVADDEAIPNVEMGNVTRGTICSNAKYRRGGGCGSVQIDCVREVVQDIVANGVEVSAAVSNVVFDEGGITGGQVDLNERGVLDKVAEG
jgi:hypothetical protein